MYQSKLARPEVKPHFFWSKTLKEWRYYFEKTETLSEIKRNSICCVNLYRTYNPLKANK